MSSKLAHVAHTTLAFMNENVSKLTPLGIKLNSARERTVHYKDEDIFELESREKSFETIIEVTREKTLIAAKKLILEGWDKPCAMNFANAFNPGGGFLDGARAQEENLCRVSGLFHCIRNQSLYERNFEAGGSSGLYLHDMLYSPDVPVFRDSDTYAFLDDAESFDVCFITCPAPNWWDYSLVDVSAELVSDTIKERLRRILVVAAKQGHTTLILGAFGCGAFRNEPEMVANHFKFLLSGPFLNVFKKVVFAVYEAEDGPNITVFKRVLMKP